MTDPLLTVVVLAKDEPDLARVVGGLHKALGALLSYETFLVVDTQQEIDACRIPFDRILLNEGNGPGDKIRTGIKAARGTFVVPFMGDGSDNPHDIVFMLSWAVTTPVDLVCASRYRGGKRIGGPKILGFLSRMAGLSLHWLGVPISDATNAFKLYRREKVPTNLDSEGFEVSLEILYRMLAKGAKTAEIATTWTGRKKGRGRSKFRFWDWLPGYLYWYRKLVIWCVA